MDKNYYLKFLHDLDQFGAALDINTAKLIPYAQELLYQIAAIDNDIDRMTKWKKPYHELNKSDQELVLVKLEAFTITDYKGRLD